MHSYVYYYFLFAENTDLRTYNSPFDPKSVHRRRIYVGIRVVACISSRDIPTMSLFLECGEVTDEEN